MKKENIDWMKTESGRARKCRRGGRGRNLREWRSRKAETGTGDGASQALEGRK